MDNPVTGLPDEIWADIEAKARHDVQSFIAMLAEDFVRVGARDVLAQQGLPSNVRVRMDMMSVCEQTAQGAEIIEELSVALALKRGYALRARMGP